MTSIEALLRIARGDVPDSDERDRKCVKYLTREGLLETDADGRVVLTDKGWEVLEAAS